MLLSVERPNRRSLCLSMTRGHAAALYGLVQAVLPASVWNMADGLLRFPKNLGDPVASSATSRLETPGYQLRALAAHSSARERKQRVQPRYHQTKETKCGGMGGRDSEHLIVPLKPGNPIPRETRWRQGDVVSWNRSRERWRRLWAPAPSTRNDGG